jgi:6-pyruvoyltetrahydropterin/6-carboxytetrahydropterin synthase
MYTVRVEGDFSAAHFLRSYHGKCEQLHGHNYRVRLWVQSRELDEGGMLVDFTLLKDTLRQICKTMDHTNLNDNSLFDNNPSAERIARHIFEEAARILPPEAAQFLRAVDVYETPKNMARYGNEPDVLF